MKITWRDVLIYLVDLLCHPSLAIGICIGVSLAVPVMREAFDQVDLRLDRVSICQGQQP